jgi:putative peptide zinc metalloprotease protein
VKRLLIILAANVAALGLAGFRPDDARAQDTAAVAVNTKDGSSIFRLAFAIKRAAGDVVDNSNAAVAFASCTDCQTVAISIQIVLVTGDPEAVTPENIALAYNILCTGCDTLASAYQWVLSTGGAVHFSAAGNQELAQIRRELLALRGSELSGPDIQARIDELMQRLGRVLEHELVVVTQARPGPPPQETTSTEAPAQTTGTETVPTETVSTTPTEPATTDTTPTETAPTITP